MEIKKSHINMNKVIHEGSGQTLVDMDINVPDSKPDVLKILQVDGCCIVEGKEIMEGRINIRGRVDCKILYVPDNARGVRSILQSLPFNYNEEIGDAAPDMCFLAGGDVTHIEYQMIHSRKISVKAVVELEKKIIGQNSIEYVSGVEGEGIEIREKQFSGNHLMVHKEVEFTVADKFSMPGQKDMQTLLKYDGEIKNKDIKIISNKVVAKGEVSVCTLYGTEEEGVNFIENVIPFTEILDVEGIAENQQTTVNFYLQDLQLSMEQGTEEEMKISCEGKIMVSITGEEKISVSAVSDAYATRNKLMLNTSPVTIQEVGDRVQTQTSLREVLGPQEGAPELVRIYNVIAKPYIGSTSVMNNKINIEGSVDCYILYISDKEDNLVQSAMYQIPFNTAIEGNYKEGCKVNASVSTAHLSYSLSAGGETEVRITLDITAATVRNQEMPIVTDIEVSEEELEDRPTIVLYFVQAGDNMWDVAKRYHSKIDEIEQVNKIENGQIKPGMMLLIPKN